MNCQTAIHAIVMASTGDLPPEGAEALGSHLLICARCRSEEKIAAVITAALKTDREPAPGADFTVHVLERIRDDGEAAPRERRWMPLIPAAALLSSIGAVWLTYPLIPWREMANALGSHLLPPLAGPAVLVPFSSILPAVLVLSAGLFAFAAREFATFMRE
jgi:hypothetical protein